MGQGAPIHVVGCLGLECCSDTRQYSGSLLRDLGAFPNTYRWAPVTESQAGVVGRNGYLRHYPLLTSGQKYYTF